MIFLLALLLAVNTPASSDANNSVTTTLRAKDEALLDAIAPGTKKVWEDALASEAVYVDESGMILDRKAFLDQLTPLPAGASGKRGNRQTTRRMSRRPRHCDRSRQRAGNLSWSRTYGAIPDHRNLATRRRRMEAVLIHTYAVLEPANDHPAREGVGGSMSANRVPLNDLTYVIRLDGERRVGGERHVAKAARCRGAMCVRAGTAAHSQDL